jgi:hypothetical protein
METNMKLDELIKIHILDVMENINYENCVDVTNWDVEDVIDLLCDDE